MSGHGTSGFQTSSAQIASIGSSLYGVELISDGSNACSIVVYDGNKTAPAANLAVSATGADYSFGLTTAASLGAQSFQVTQNGNITSATLTFKLDAGTVSGNIVASIRSDSAGAPGTTLVTSAGVSSASLNSTTGTALTFTFAPTALTTSTTYWLVFDYSGITFNGHQIYTLSDGGGNTYPSGHASYSTNSGSAWNSLATYDLVFSVDGTVAVYTGTVVTDLSIPASTVAPQTVFFNDPVVCNTGIAVNLTGTGSTYIIYYNPE